MTTSSPEPDPRHAGWSEVTDVEALTAIIGEPGPRAREKVRHALTELDVAWLESSPFCVLATAAADGGGLDASPKGDPAGQLVHVLDDTTLAIAERPGNRRVDGYKNVLANPHVGMNFLIPGRGDTLRVNGTARLVTDGPFFDDMVVKGHRPVLVLVVHVEQVYYHCAKAFLRSQTWQPETWAPEAMPRHAVIAKELVRRDQTLEELDAYYGSGYGTGLYPDNTGP